MWILEPIVIGICASGGGGEERRPQRPTSWLGPTRPPCRGQRRPIGGALLGPRGRLEQAPAALQHLPVQIRSRLLHREIAKSEAVQRRQPAGGASPAAGERCPSAPAPARRHQPAPMRGSGASVRTVWARQRTDSWRAPHRCGALCGPGRAPPCPCAPSRGAARSCRPCEAHSYPPCAAAPRTRTNAYARAQRCWPLCEPAPRLPRTNPPPSG